ncbi:alkaline phosphatase D family protein [Ramlibacter tataouinensis]|uniref:Candidate alkaline phosphatase D n=1 Tax=Ramlibacter tataouinensis (strain ATCC BAA-407 / DSM 14655 / LMG 21543 / TTB310) TaxID=365046 RepID=F5XVP7_RAMTT|nr:alkaline phosphatase D family protein [Ramlibacter tataouinensis]AEG92810.1 candidate alkaline phosphatase D precursor [Ramlibacter tataouinensis TTB310]
MVEPVLAERRRLLQLAAAAAACTWLPRGAHAQRRWGFDPFSLGVASGSPAADSVVLWTRLLGPGWWDSIGEAPVPVRWEVAHDQGFSRIARRGETLALAQLGHSVHAEVAGLEPDRWYFYRFTAGHAVSPTGRTRTLPAADALPARLRLAYASCQRWEHGYYGAYRHMREEQLDLVMFLGDYIYEYPNATAAVRDFPTLGWVHTLQEYRERHALHRGDVHLQAMHAACPWLVSWDDHEVQNDYAAGQAGDGRPLGLNASSDFAARRAAAYQAYYEHMPLRASALGGALAGVAGAADVRLYGRWRFGRLADLLLLDTRQYRDRQVCGPDFKPSGQVHPSACPAWEDPGRSLLGAAQEQWLDTAFAQAGSGWTVVGQQTLFGRRDNHPGAGEQFWNDGWDGYGAARRRVTGSLQRHQVVNPVFLGGDVHENWVGHVKADYARQGSASLGVEFCGTSITSRAGGAEQVAQRLAENPHYVFADGWRRGYSVCEFTPQRLTTTLRVLDDATREDARIETQARFTVQAGRPRLERA